MIKKYIVLLTTAFSIFIVMPVLAQPTVSYHPITFKGQSIKFDSNKVYKLVKKLPEKKSKKPLSKKDVENIAKDFGLFDVDEPNDHLNFQGGDVTYFFNEHKKNSKIDLWLEFASRKAVLEAANKNGVIIDTPGDLSHLAKQIMANMKREKYNIK